jgi:hypothetical protein
VITETERERIRGLARQEVAASAPPASLEQLATIAALMGPAVREAQAARTQDGGGRADRGAA